MYFVELTALLFLAAPPPPLSVCKVLESDPTKLNGRTITVRGILASSDEGTWLIEECKTHLVTRGLSWNNALSVYVDVSDEKTAVSWGTISRKVRQLHADELRDTIWVTITGRLETRKSMDDEVVEMPWGLRRAGFGHMGTAPAEINVITVDDVTIEPRRGDHK